ncbi:DEAD/DEAH box helicase, partial [Enterococcus faecium]
IYEIWDNVDDNTKGIWSDLAESQGFYPYIRERMDNTSEIRRSFHRSEYIDNIVFHKEQKTLSYLIKKKQNLIVSAPTSFGKSLL